MVKKLTIKDYEEMVKAIAERTVSNVNETVGVKATRIARLKGDYNAFVQYYFPHYCEEDGKLIDCGWFQIEFANRLLADDNYFGVNEWPREHAKTVHAGVIAPYWLMAHGKLDGMLTVGRTDDAAKKILADIQAEAEGNQRLIADYGAMKTHGSWAEGDFEFKSGIFFVGLGLGGNPRGLRKRQRRPNYGLGSDLDDDEMVLNQKRVRAAVKWILGAFYPALRIKKKRFVIEGNRINKQSILAHIVGDITPNTPKRKRVTHIKVVAYDDNGVCAWKERFTKADIDAQIEVMGTGLGMREYFHVSNIEGTVFKEEWIKWGKVPPAEEMDAIVEYCDPSDKGNVTSCYKSISRWGKKGKYYYKMKCYCRQDTNTNMWQWWYEHYEPAMGAYLFMETIFGQDRYLEDCEEEGIQRGWQLPVIPDGDAKTDKMTRIISTFQSLYQRGLIIYNIDEQGDPDMQESKNQLIAIEQGSTYFIDGPDADQGAVEKLNGLARTGGDYKRTDGKYEHTNEY